jgi:hypothetical protein
MIYNEKYVSRAYTVEQLIYILSTEVPKDAELEVSAGDRAPDVEVWYDKGTNTVILK